MKTTKIIDLLNKRANNEELPKKIKYNNETYMCVDNNYYISISEMKTDDDGEEYCPYILEHMNIFSSILNEEVEILEDKPTKIDKIAVNNSRILDFTDENGEYHIDTNRKDRDIYVPKINELVDKVNYLLEKSE